MVKTETVFRSSNGRTPIHAVEWRPDGAVRAVLQISHGVSEYILRYEGLAEYLTDRGIAVVGHDHIGHGSSVAAGMPRLYFGSKGSWFQVVDDLYTRQKFARRSFPGVPCFLLGHSMGSFLARSYLIRYPGTVDGAILMGTGQMPAPVLSAARMVAFREGRRLGWDRVSPLVDELAFGAYNRKFAPNRTAYDWLSVNRENVDAYIAHPYCGGSPTIGLFREMIGGMAFNQKPEHLRRMNLSTPVLFLSGSKDPVGNCGRGVKQAYRSFCRTGVRDVSIKLYPGLRHEILHETCRDVVYQDILRWLDMELHRMSNPPDVR